MRMTRLDQPDQPSYYTHIKGYELTYKHLKKTLDFSFTFFLGKEVLLFAHKLGTMMMMIRMINAVADGR